MSNFNEWTLDKTFVFIFTCTFLVELDFREQLYYLMWLLVIVYVMQWFNLIWLVGNLVGHLRMCTRGLWSVFFMAFYYFIILYMLNLKLMFMMCVLKSSCDILVWGLVWVPIAYCGAKFEYWSFCGFETYCGLWEYGRLSWYIIMEWIKKGA